ncbi:MAG: hypothetical protein R2849_15775 [Thermomicrobiales bacterium]
MFSPLFTGNQLVRHRRSGRFRQRRWRRRSGPDQTWIEQDRVEAHPARAGLPEVPLGCFLKRREFLPLAAVARPE